MKKFTHLTLAKYYWDLILAPGDTVIDATLGNGHDTLYLAKKVLTAPEGRVYGFDIQIKALQNTRKRLEDNLAPHDLKNIFLYLSSHSELDQIKSPVKLCVYNLGYLPGGDKNQTTLTKTTLLSIQKALKISRALSITFYPGHAEGKAEQEEILSYFSKFDPRAYNICHHTWLAQEKAPSFLWIFQIN